MIIHKAQIQETNYKKNEFFYNRARDAMYDIVNQLVKLGYTNILLPGYIGWSPKEGSGIFDPINRIDSISKTYYKMSRNLEIDLDDIVRKASDSSIVLLVSYFGFRDLKIKQIIKELRKKKVFILEDNAHGFFTYIKESTLDIDATFFSLHKMFPFPKGGSLIVKNKDFPISKLNKMVELPFNPYTFDLQAIADIKIENYKKLFELTRYCKYFNVFHDLSYLNTNVPQTFPIIIKVGCRDKIYELMNQRGYGVVSLYHTMIPDLAGDEYKDSRWLAKRIMNLPVHQDVDATKYSEMVDELIKCCKETEYVNYD